MRRSRRRSVRTVALLALALAAGSPGVAQDAGAEKWLIDRTLTVAPRTEPVPALRYRFFPLSSERKDGNAVPIYLRFAHERRDETKKLLQERTKQWNELPLEKLPVTEARMYLDGWKYNLRQLELGARRKTADWNYTLDAGDLVGILLPDAHEMRMQSQLLVLKARVEMAEGKPAEAARTLETGFAFNRQVAEGPFLINQLVGMAGSNQLADSVLDFVQRPDAPNLYWALTVMPRPVIDIRFGAEFEERLAEGQLPDLADLDRPRPASEWDVTLARVRQGIDRLVERDTEDLRRRPEGAAPTDPAAKSPDLAAAKQYLKERAHLPAAEVDAMPPAQLLLVFLYRQYSEYRDDAYKAAYLPYRDARRVFEESEQRLKAAPLTEGVRLARILNAALGKVWVAQVRLERRLAALRTIEALRLHAVATGEWPETLAQIQVVPVPDDPGTGRPFAYSRSGSTATLISRLPGEPLETNGLRYRLVLANRRR